MGKASKLADMRIEAPEPSRIRQAAQAWAADDDPIVKLTARVPESFRDKLNVYAAQNKQKVQDLIVRALKQAIPELAD